MLMILARSGKIMRTGVANTSVSRIICSYEDAVKALNGLQSNAAYLRNAKMHNSRPGNKLDKMRKYIHRAGISLEQLDKLSVIHVAGTKGKGSACAFTESLLRAHGFKTGLYTSPHLISVRERIRINGEPIDEKKFVTHFSRLYEILKNKQEGEKDMPQYFQFLTLLMFHVFMKETIDVAIIEVGIGGEYDCTNILRNPVCVGITSLGFDHTNLLGNTLREIAYQKSGIFKNGTRAFSVPQSIEAMSVLESRACEKNIKLSIVSPLKSYSWPKGEPPLLGISGDHQFGNASIAISMARTWIDRSIPKKQTTFSFDTAALALSCCKWPGRTQILSYEKIIFYLDGAHTRESMDCCAKWFDDVTKNHQGKRILFFNATGDRDPAVLLEILRPLNFDRVYFMPNISGNPRIIDQINYNILHDEWSTKCERYRNTWGDGAICTSSFDDALRRASAERKNSSNDKLRVLVTGSLHLVGAALAVLDPDLTTSTKI